MKRAADFRKNARIALQGNWPVAVLTGFVASLIGANIAASSDGSSSNTDDSSNTLIQDFQTTELWMYLQAFLIIALIVILIWSITTMIISGAGKLGYAIFNLKLIDYEEVSFSDLFSQFHRLGEGFCMNFLIALYTLLWSLLFIIPGIIKSFSYAMTPYILVENSDMSVSDAITESRRIMDGNKWRLFCLQFSFIGWKILCAVPMMIAVAMLSEIISRGGTIEMLLWIIPFCIPTFIGSLFLVPYQEAAQAAFYRDVAGTPQPILFHSYGEGSTWTNN